MQTESNNAYRNDPLFPPIPKDYHERMENVLKSLPVESHKVRIPKKRGIILLAAALAALLAVGTAVAVSMSTRDQLQEAVENRIETSDDERYAQAREMAIDRITNDVWERPIPLDVSAAVGDVTLTLKEIEVYGGEATLLIKPESERTGMVVTLDQEDYRNDTHTQRIVSAHEQICAFGTDATAFRLTIGDTNYEPYVVDDIAARYTEDDAFYLTFHDVPRTIENGTKLTLSGTLYLCDGDGRRTGEIGSFSIPFVYDYTDEMREADIQKLTEEILSTNDRIDAATHDQLAALPEQATSLEVSVGMTTYHDVASDEQGILLGLTKRFTEIGWYDYTYFCMDGYFVTDEHLAQEFAPDRKSGTQLLRLPYYADAAYLPDVLTIACVHMIGQLTPLEPEGWSGPDSWETAVFVFRYNRKTGEVSLPKNDAERDAWFTPQDLTITTTSLDPFYDYCETVDVSGVADTQNGTTVTIKSVAFKPDGTMYILFSADHLACEVIAWETMPKAICLNGVTVDAAGAEPGFYMDEESIAFTLDTYNMQKTRWINSYWSMKPPMRRDMYDGPITIEIKDWDLYDLNAQGEREFVGTFSFTFTIPSDGSAYTVQPRFDVF